MALNLRDRLLLLLLSSSSSSLSPLCTVFIIILLTQSMSIENTVLQLFCCAIHGAYIVSFNVESIVFLHQYFRSMCAVPSIAVFSSDLTSCFPGKLLKYFLNDFEIFPVLLLLLVSTLFLHSSSAVFLL